MHKKLLYVLVIVFAASVLAACGGATPAATTQAPSGGGAATQAPAAATEAPAAATEAPAAAGGVTELNILWAQWDPADYLQQLTADYTAQTGIKVNIVQEPWGSFGDRFFTEMAAGGDAWDMVIGDSQWLGQGAVQGHYVDLTDFMTSNSLDKTVTPATLTYYGEYPAGSGKYWGLPDRR